VVLLAPRPRHATAPPERELWTTGIGWSRYYLDMTYGRRDGSRFGASAGFAIQFTCYAISFSGGTGFVWR
jgi:hypothetical protein